MPTPQIAQTGILDLIAQAGWMAKFVLLILLGASIFSWAVILTKYKSIKRASTQNGDFLELFWQGKNIDEIFSKSDQYPHSPVAAVFKSGVRELKKLSAPDLEQGSALSIENIQRALVRTSNAEITSYEKYVGFLATTASAAPFVGLFGTVWGIMNSFQNIGATGAASLAVVAPGISEALITTATGIGAAIPAVVAYNYFANQIKRLSVDMECFGQDFLNIVQRSLLSSRKGD